MSKLSSGRIPEIDGLRGIAVLGVLVWHFTGSMVANDGSLTSSLVMRMTVFGRTGVDLFFVLSGFLIIGLLVDHRESGNLFRVFYARRFFRIWPPYLLLIALYWTCYAFLGESEGFNTRYGFWTQIGAQLTFNWNLLMAAFDSAVARGFSVAWSVNIEEWFYIVFPIFIVLVRPNRLAYFLLAVGLASAGARLAVHLAFPKAWLAPYVLLPFRMDGLCAGGLVALAVRDERIVGFIQQNRQTVSRLAIGSVLLAAVLVIVSLKNLDSNMYIWGHLYLSISFALTVLTAVILGGRILQSSLLKELGRYSYTLYLVHPLFISLYFQLAQRPERILNLNDSLLALAALASSLLLSVASYWLMERPLVAKGRAWKYVYSTQNLPTSS